MSDGEPLKDQIDRQLLVRLDPPCHADARKRLEAAKLTVGWIIHVYPDCVLYIDPEAHAMTAWLVKTGVGDAVAYKVEPGFAAFPNPYILGETE